MLSDVHLVEQARRLIRDDKTSAEWAVRKSLNQIQAVFERIEDPYFRDRKSDVALVGERLLRTLVGSNDSTSAEEAPKGSITIAHELSPADAAQLGRAEAAGFCTEGGGRTSHTAIIARAIRIGSLACAIAEFSSTASQPSSMAIAASEAVPTPASTRNGTLVCSRIIQIIAAFWMPSPEPIGAPRGIIATHPMSSSRLHATGSSAV